MTKYIAGTHELDSQTRAELLLKAVKRNDLTVCNFILDNNSDFDVLLKQAIELGHKEVEIYLKEYANKLQGSITIVGR